MPKPPRPPRPSLLGALLPEGGKSLHSSLRKRLCCSSFTCGYCRELSVVSPKACFIQKKKGICSTLGILRCCSWGLGPPTWSACPVRIQGEGLGSRLEYQGRFRLEIRGEQLDSIPEAFPTSAIPWLHDHVGNLIMGLLEWILWTKLVPFPGEHRVCVQGKFKESRKFKL